MSIAPFRLAGSAGGVEQRGEVVGAALHRVETIRHRPARLDEGAALSGAEGERLADTVLPAQPGDAARRRRSRHHQPGLGIAEEVVQLPFRIRRVEWQVDRACPQAREVEDERPRRLLHLHRDAIAGHNAPLVHQARVARRLGPQRPPRTIPRRPVSRGRRWSGRGGNALQAVRTDWRRSSDEGSILHRGAETPIAQRGSGHD